jgi:hypothetical protein
MHRLDTVVCLFGNGWSHGSFTFVSGGRGREMGKFHRAVVPTWLIIGLYNKVVNGEGHIKWSAGLFPLRSRILS